MDAMFFEYMRSPVPLTIRHPHLRVLIGIFIIYGLCAFQELLWDNLMGLLGVPRGLSGEI